jgi:hypothetical protein
MLREVFQKFLNQGLLMKINQRIIIIQITQTIPKELRDLGELMS